MPNKPILPKRVLEQHTISRYERERRTRKYVVIGSIVVAILVVLLIAAYLLQTLVFEPNRAVATVNGQDITVAQVQARMRLEFSDISYNYNQLASQIQQLQASNDENNSFLVQFYQQQLQQVSSRASVDQIARTSLDDLIDQALIRQEATRRGITVSTEELEKDIETSLGFYRSTLTPFPTVTPITPEPTALLTATPISATNPLTATAPITPSPTQGPLPTATPRLQPTSITQADLQQSRERGVAFYKELGYGPDQFQHVYETSLLTKKLQEVMGKEVPTRTQHYAFDYVRFNSAVSATHYSQLIASKAITFDMAITLANTITQPEPLGLGAHRDWTSQASVESQFGNEVLAALESAPLNQPTSVITSAVTGGFYVLLPLGREVRPLDEADLTQAQSKAYQDWLTAAQGDANTVQRKVEPIMVMPREIRTAVEQFQQNLSGQSSP